MLRPKNITNDLHLIQGNGQEHCKINASSGPCSANQMTGFYMKCNTGLKWVNCVSQDIVSG